MRNFTRKLFDLEIAARAASAIRENQSLAARTPPSGEGVDLCFCFVDHFEPQHGRPPRELAQERMLDWEARYPGIADRHRDFDGRPPVHSFFYPWDEYDPWELEHLVGLCRRGYGEVELHLHHQDDTEAGLRAKLREAVETFRRAGALSEWPDGRPAWGFIHGNWALDNSRCDDGRNYCGVNNELTVLREEGCYADFTFPAWQHEAQPRWTNGLAYAVDDSGPKSYERAEPVHVGGKGSADSLLLIQGPLAPFRRKWRPAVDDGDLASYRRYHPERLDRWVSAAIHVRGRGDRRFIKIHTHGAPEANRNALLGQDFEALFADAERRYNDGRRFRLHYVSARELFNIVKATEAGASIDVGEARDWLIPPPHSVPSPATA